MDKIVPQGRIKNVARNTFFSAITFVVKTVLQFVLRTIFIRYLSVEFLGLNGLFANILQLLSLAELGVGQAIVYSMYRPISEGDTVTINSLIRFYKKIYIIIGVIIIATSLILTPFIPFIVDASNLDVNIYVVFLVFAGNTAIGYFFAHRRAIIFANQRGDIESKVQGLAQILLYTLQIALLALFQNYYLYIIILPLTTLLDSIIVSIISKRKYPEVTGRGEKLDKAISSEIKKNTLAMLVYRISYVVVISTDSIVISSFLGLEVLGLYSNYTLVTNAVYSVVLLFVVAIRSSVGNLISEGNKEHSYIVFQRLNFIFYMLVAFACTCLVVLLQHFVGVWVGADYSLQFSIVVMMCINLYLLSVRNVVNSFKEGAGLFTKGVVGPIVESLSNLIISIVLVNFLGLIGVVIGTICSCLIMSVWYEPLVLYKYYFKKPVRWYYLRYIIYSIIFAGIAVGLWFVCSFLPTTGWLWLIIKLLICIGGSFGCYLILFWKLPELRYAINLTLSVMKKVILRICRKKTTAEKDLLVQGNCESTQDEVADANDGNNPIDASISNSDQSESH